jgi:hypothetical protein
MDQTTPDASFGPSPNLNPLRPSSPSCSPAFVVDGLRVVVVVLTVVVAVVVVVVSGYR